jgi:hypothetical protein
MRRFAKSLGTIMGVSVLLAGVASTAVAEPWAFDNFVGGPAGAGAGENRMVRALAVNDETGQVYVADPLTSRVSRFASDGRFELMWGRGVETGGTAAEVCTAAEAPCLTGSKGEGAGMFADPWGVAVNQETGDVYVLDAGNRRIQQFGFGDGGTPADPSDDEPTFERTWGWGVDDGTPEFQICASGCQAGLEEATGVGGFRNFNGLANLIAVGSADGDVFVAGSGRVQRFDADGTPDADPVIDLSGGGFSVPRGVAVDSLGIVYIAEGYDRSEIQRYDSGGIHGSPGFIASISEPPLLAGAPNVEGQQDPTRGLAVDPDSDGPGPDVDRLYVLRDPAAGDTVIQQFDSPGQPTPPLEVTETHGAGVFGDAQALSGFALNAASRTLYIGGGTGSEPGGPEHLGGVGYYTLDEDGTDAQVFATLTTADADARSATFSGTVDPTDGTAQYRFEYSRDGGDWTALPTRSVTGNGPQPVSGSVSGLEANAPYQVRLVARKILGVQSSVTVNPAPQQGFTTDAIPPDVETGPVQQVSATRAQLLGTLNANNLPTSYHFEYGTDPGYGRQAPLPAGALSGGTPRVVGARLTGLSPATVYHYRLVATNDEGTEHGADRTFTTRVATTVSPTGRALEMVTPPEKVNRRASEKSSNGFQLANVGFPTKDGEAMLYGVSASVLDPDAGTAFPTTPDYTRLERRPGVGWATETVHNVPGVDSAATPTHSLHGASADFRSLAFWESVSFFADTRSNLSTRLMGDAGGLNGSGWYDWISDAALAASNKGQAGDQALIDDDRMVRWGEHRGLLGADDPSLGQLGGRAIYREEPVGSGARHLVNLCTAGTTVPERLVANTISDRPCVAGSPVSRRGGAVGAGGAAATGPAARAMSEDGRRIFFMSPDPADEDVPTASCAGGTATGSQTDCPPQLFVRQYDSNGEATVRWVSRPHTLGQPIGLFGSGAYYESASADGQYVYFRTNAPLTPDDPNAGSATVAATASWDLYRFKLAGNVDADPTGPGSELLRISGGNGGAADSNTNGRGNEDAGPAVRYLSADGSRAYFVTTSALPDAAADNAPPAGSSAANVADGGVSSSNGSVRHLYLYDDSKEGAGRWKFIAQLPAASDDRDAIDMCATRGQLSGMTQVGSSSPYGPPYAARRGNNCMRGDDAGRAVVFETTGRLTDDDTDAAGDIYRYDAAADELVRVSAPPAGAEPYSCNENASGTVVEVCNADLGKAPAMTTTHDAFGLSGLHHYNVTNDGRVFFESRLPLVADDTDDRLMDVYEWREGELTLVSPAGDGPDDVFYSGNSSDGVSVFLWTTQRIDPREIEDGDPDIYVARVGGGFPPPPPPPILCDVLVDGCQGGGGVPLAAPTDSDESGGGANLPARRRPVLVALRPGRAALRRAARTGVVPLRVRTSGAGQIAVVARARTVGRRGKPRIRSIGSTRRKVRHAGVHVLKLRLHRTAVRHLRSGRGLRVQIVVQQAGARKRTVSFVLRRPR